MAARYSALVHLNLVMSVTPTVSVIIPAYNAARFIHNALDSVLAQTYRPHEIIIVDDGSRDDTAARVAEYGAAVTLIRQQNAGPAAARNHGAGVATSEWLALLDADDTWLPVKLERQTAYTAEDEVAVVHCPSTGSRWEWAPGERISFERLWAENCIGNSSVLIRRSVFEALGGFDEARNLIGIEDYNLWLRLAASGYQIVTCPDQLWHYTYAAGSLSSNTEKFAQAELANIASIQEVLSIPASVAERKRQAIYTQYGRDLLWERKMDAARRYLSSALRHRPTFQTAGNWLATFMPVHVLDLIRRLRAPRSGEAGGSLQQPLRR